MKYYFIIVFYLTTYRLLSNYHCLCPFYQTVTLILLVVLELLQLILHLILLLFFHDYSLQ
ncbi:hypothetical protein E0H99_07070 [Flavobacterium sp. GT3P67]|nr:hypothetical protein E0H99_07070 [Flavobacterium sp. GT3P67]